MSGLVDNIRASLLGLKMPRALEMLDHTIQRLEKGELGAIEAIDGLLSEEFNCREGRRIGVSGTLCIGFRPGSILTALSPASVRSDLRT